MLQLASITEEVGGTPGLGSPVSGGPGKRSQKEMGTNIFSLIIQESLAEPMVPPNLGNLSHMLSDLIKFL